MSNGILKVLDEALFAAMREASASPAKHQFVIVLSTDARNELWSHPDILRQLSYWVGDKHQERYRGCPIAVCHDEEAAPVAVYARRP